MKRKINYKLWLNIIFIIFIFLVGILLGSFFGMLLGTYTLVDHIFEGLSGSTFIINFNETKLVEEFNKTIVPSIISEVKK